MAFNINNWGRWSVSYNSFPPNQWGYTGIENGETDTLETIKASGYFDGLPPVFLRIGHLIYAEGEPTIPVQASRELLVVTGLNPTTVIGVSGLSPLWTVINSASATVDAVMTTQAFNLPGVLSTDIIMVNVKNTQSAARITSSITSTDLFTITWDIAPGANFMIDVLIFRLAFS